MVRNIGRVAAFGFIVAVLLAAPLSLTRAYDGNPTFLIDLVAKPHATGSCDATVTITATMRDRETGNLAVGEAIHWSFDSSPSAEDQLSPKTSITDSDGKASTTLSFGPVPGPRTVAAEPVPDSHRTIQVDCQGTNRTPRPTPSPTPKPTPTPTPKPTSRPTATPTPRPTHSVQPTATAPGSTPTPTASATAMATPTSVASLPLETPVPTATPSAQPTDTPTAAAATATAGAVATVEPTGAPSVPPTSSVVSPYDAPDSGNTGDTTPVALLGLLMVGISVVGIVVVARR
jgi:hypothetical protein